VIIYKFTQGNLGAKKIARSQFQSPAKKKKSQIATLATDSAIPETNHAEFCSMHFVYRIHIYTLWYVDFM
jgi:hypothetical protein